MRDINQLQFIVKSAVRRKCLPNELTFFIRGALGDNYGVILFLKSELMMKFTFAEIQRKLSWRYGAIDLLFQLSYLFTKNRKISQSSLEAFYFILSQCKRCICLNKSRVIHQFQFSCELNWFLV